MKFQFKVDKSQILGMNHQAGLAYSPAKILYPVSTRKGSDIL